MATVQDVLSRADEVINDPGNIRWTEASKIRWLNDALDLLSQAVPELFAARGSHTCTAGSFQSLAIARARVLVGVVGVLPCIKQSLDAFAPGWQAGVPSATAMHWMPAGTGPRDFLLYPPSTTGQSLAVDYVATPAKLTSPSDTLPVTDDYVSALADYVAGMSEAKDAEHVESGRSSLFMQAFASKIGIKK